MRTATLRQQHDIILERAISIQDMARTLDGERQVDALLREFRRFDGVLTSHLVSEDTFLYPEMIGSGDAGASTTAARFSEEMGGLSDSYKAFTQEWLEPSRIRADPMGFRKAFTKIVFALSNRIHRENNELYPLADAIREEALERETRKRA